MEQDANEAAYRLLAERLKANPVETTINEELMEILHHLYAESEAMVGEKFPMAPMKPEGIVRKARVACLAQKLSSSPWEMAKFNPPTLPSTQQITKRRSKQ